MAHTFNPITQEAEAGESLSTKQDPGQPGPLHREILSQKLKNQSFPLKKDYS